MSNPHTRGHYPYQNEAERSLDPAGNVSEHAVNRMDRMPRSAVGPQTMDKDPVYRTAPEQPRQEEGSPLNYAAHERGFGMRRENSHSSAAAPHSDPHYEPARPHYGPWQEPAIRRALPDRTENWRDTERHEAMDKWHRASYGPPHEETSRYSDEPVANTRTLPVRERRGPRNYVRSDERIRDEICERLVRDPRLEVGEVSIEVKDGTVLLSGTVPERRMKHAVEDVVDDCWGVTDIENRLRVARAETEPDGTPSVWRNRLGKES
jgi:BON domain